MRERTREDRISERETRAFERFWESVDEVVALIGWDELQEQIAKARAESEAKK